MRNGEIRGAYCVGYLTGIANTSEFYNHVVRSELRACIPSGVTNGQLVKVFVKFADDNPALLHEPQGNGVIAAFGAAFPCPAAQPAP